MLDKIEQDKELFEITLQSIGDGVIATDTDDNIIIMNAVAEYLTGWSRVNAIGAPLSRIFVIKDKKSDCIIENPFRVSLEQGLTSGLKENYILLSRDGTSRYASASSSPIKDKQGDIVGMVVVFRDISRIRQNEEQVRKLSLINEQSTNSIIITDREGFIEYANPSFLRSWGISLESVINKSFYELGLPAVLPKIEDIKDALRDKGEWRGEIPFVGSKSDSRWMAILLSTIRDIDGRVSNLFVIAQDITERKMVEEKLKKAKEEAESANRAKAEFLANMSHEIRTPLNGIIGMTSLALLSELNPEQRENLSIVKMSGDLLLRMIDDILDFSKIEAGKMNIEESDFDIRELVLSTISLHSARVNEKGLKINWQIDENIPEVLRGDPHRLQQVFINLINNALKFTVQGQVSVEVGIHRWMESYILLKVSISDTGIGIAEEQMDKLFHSFSQVDGSITKKFGGTGLGLYISKQLVGIMGGEIWVDSVVGQGSTFHFTAKLGISDKEPYLIANTPVNMELGIEKALQVLKILLVEDHKVNQLVISNLLNARGHKVDVANNGKEALQILDKKSYDIILMDILMPEMDGLEATRMIRMKEHSEGSNTPIIALTAHAVFGDREKFLSAGMDDYIAKPVQMERLFEAVETAVSSRKESSYPKAPIKFLTPKDLFFQVYQDFIDKLQAEIQNLSAANKAANLDRIESSAHRIKELANQMDDINIKNLAFKIELAARKADLKQADLLINRLQEQFTYLESMGN